MKAEKIRKRMTASSVLGRAEYYRVGGPHQSEPYDDLQYKRTPSRIPWKSILLAVFLSVMGTLLLVIGSLLLTEHIDVHTFPPNRTWPMLLLGAIMFIPGVYHVRLAVLAWRGYDGYSFEDIPDFD